MLVQINTIVLERSTINSVHIKRNYATGGATINIMAMKDQGRNMHLEADTSDEAIEVYLDIVTQMAVADGVPMPLKLIKLRRAELYETLQQSQKVQTDNTSGGESTGNESSTLLSKEDVNDSPLTQEPEDETVEGQAVEPSITIVECPTCEAHISLNTASITDAAPMAICSACSERFPIKGNIISEPESDKSDT